jgi:hypothetical protein
VSARPPHRRRGLGEGAIDSDLVEHEPDNPVVGLKRDPFEPGEDAESSPLIAAGVV